MIVDDPAAPPETRSTTGFAQLPTGAKAFIFLSVALLPLALLVVIAAFQTARTADFESRSRLRLAGAESSRTLAIELLGDLNALRATLAAIERDPADAPSCARVRGVFAQGIASGVVLSIHDAEGTLRCGRELPEARTGAVGLAAQILPGRGLTLTIRGTRAARASVFFPVSFLADVSQPTGFTAPYALSLGTGEAQLELRTLDLPPVARRDRLISDIGFADLRLEMVTPSAPISSPTIVAMLIPVLMWIVASVIGWIVVDALMIRPLRRMQRSVRGYRPGTVYDPVAIGTIPAQEIRDFGDTFQGLSRMLVAHEADLAEGLVRQTKLTREVHHRVKNNLQVIASLINFHARSAKSADVAAAYATIQRRVDALAVVHRNHFAEMEENRGLGLRSVISELSANIRATAPETSDRLSMVLEIEPYLVSQDVAVAVAFLITELVELAMSVNPAPQIRVSLSGGGVEERATLRISSPALIETEALRDLLELRYGRIIEGLSRQLRSKLHHDPLVGAFEIAIAVTGRD